MLLRNAAYDNLFHNRFSAENTTQSVYMQQMEEKRGIQSHSQSKEKMRNNQIQNSHVTLKSTEIDHSELIRDLYQINKDKYQKQVRTSKRHAQYNMLEQINNQQEYPPIQNQKSVFLDEKGRQLDTNQLNQSDVKSEYNNEFMQKRAEQITKEKDDLSHIDILNLKSLYLLTTNHNTKFTTLIQRNKDRIPGILRYVHQNANSQQFSFLREMLTSFEHKKKSKKQNDKKPSSTSQLAQITDILTQIQELARPSEIPSNNKSLKHHNTKSRQQDLIKTLNRLDKYQPWSNQTLDSMLQNYSSS